MALWVVSPLPIRAAEGVHSPAALKSILESFGLTVRNENGKQVVEATLSQVLQLALDRNLSLEAEKVGELVAQSSLRALRERFNPTLTNTMSYARSQSPSLFSSSGAFLALAGTDAVNLSAEYSKPLNNGLSYEFTYTEKRMRALMGSIAAEGDPYSGPSSGDWMEASELKGSLSIPLYQDYGFNIQNLPARRGELGLAGSRLRIREREQQLLEVTASTYWDLVAATENVKVQVDSVALSRRLLEENRQRLETGVISPFDVQVTATQLAREQERLLNAQSEVARIEDLARAILNLELAGVHLNPLEKPQIRKPDFTFGRLLENTYRNNTTLRQLEAELSGNALDLEDARNKEQPDLDLELSYTMTGYSESPLGGVGAFGETGTDNYGATLTWKMPLFDVATPEKIRQRMLERKQLELGLATLKSDLNVRLQGILRQLRLAEQEVGTARVTMGLAEDQLKNEIIRMQVGESTSFQVAQFQQDASAARVREILARLKFERNYLALLVMTGDIYEAYDLQPAHP